MSRRLRFWTTAAVIFALLFARISVGHYVVALDKQEPTNVVIQTTYFVDGLFVAEAYPQPDSPSDINLDLNGDHDAAKSSSVSLEAAAIVCALAFLFVVSLVFHPFARTRTDELRLTPVRFRSPQLRAPPL